VRKIFVVVVVSCQGFEIGMQLYLTGIGMGPRAWRHTYTHTPLMELRDMLFPEGMQLLQNLITLSPPRKGRKSYSTPTAQRNFISVYCLFSGLIHFS
jgi:hypothetical protein